MSRAPLPTVTAAGLLALGLLATAAPAGASAPATTGSAPSAVSTPRDYYVASTGDDTGPGTGARPWRTLQRASAARLAPGDRILLRGGTTFTGRLSVGSSGTEAAPIVIGKYGSGYNPVITRGDCLDVAGSWVRVSGVNTSDCTWSGMALKGDHISVVLSTSSRNVAGIHVLPSADAASIRSSVILDNRRMSPGKTGPNDDSGAFGVLVQGSNTEVANNRISGQHAPSADYGTDGSAVEVYGGRGTVIAGNNAIDNLTFVELGDSSTTGTRIVRNTVASSVPDGHAVVTRGAQDSFGPVAGTVLEHNSIAMNGARSGGYVCYAGCSPAILTARANVIVATARPAFADAAPGGGNNLLISDQVASSARPAFVDRRRDLRLVANSPGVDAAGACAATTISPFASPALGASSATCRDGNGDGRSGSDIGALER